MENIESLASYKATVQEEARDIFGKGNSSVTLKVLWFLKTVLSLCINWNKKLRMLLFS